MGTFTHKSTMLPRLGGGFWSLCSAGLISSAGDGAVFVGFPILAATLTHDPRVLAGVAIAQRLPWLLLSLVTGALIDRLDRRRVIVAVEGLRMVAVGGLGLAVLSHLHPLAAVYLAAFALGSLETAFAGAVGAIVPGLVDDGDLGRANGYLYGAQMTGEGILGPALGGLLAAAALSLPFLFDSVTFALSAGVVLVLVPGRNPGPTSADDRMASTQATEGVMASAWAGFRWFLADPAIRLVAGFIACLALCQGAVFSVLILWAQRYLHLSRAGYGLLLTVAAVGVVGAAIVTGRIMDRCSPARLLLGAGAAAGLAYVVLGTTTSVFVAAVTLVVEGGAVALGNVVSGAVRQRLIPPDLLGRVGNATRMCIWGAMPVGALLGGMLAHAFGLRAMFVMAGTAQLVVLTLIGGRLTRALQARAGAEAPAARSAEAVDVSDVVFDLVGETEQARRERFDSDLTGDSDESLALSRQ